MDSLTHVLFGVSIAGLAQFHPDIASQPQAAQAVLAASVAGSVFPDIDTLYRVRGNGTFLRQHRGYTHSIPFLMFSALLITGGVNYWYGDAVHPLLLLAITSFALFLHVFTDALNAYGTQIFRPFSKRRTALNVLPVYDPVIVIIHLIGLYAFANGSDAALTAAVAYALMTAYVIWRWRYSRKVLSRIAKLVDRDDLVDCYWAIPTFDPFRWHIGIRSIDGTFHTGVAYRKLIGLHDEWRSDPVDYPQIASAADQDAVRAFHEFSPHSIVQVNEHPRGTEIRWLDIRYQHRKKYPLLASVIVNKANEPVHAFVGWSDDRTLWRKQNNLKSPVRF